jgi:dehydrogenase/reductase SDR family protein 12
MVPTIAQFASIFFFITVLTSDQVASGSATSSPNSLSRIYHIMGQGISTSQWFVYGRRNFTQNGYLRHVKNYNSPVQSRADICRGAEGADGVDMGGKCVVVTGANSGLGKQVATYAASKGANVYMICRSKERGEKARTEIIESTSNQNVKILLADVGELSQVKSAVEELQSNESQVDCLVCNAGVLLNEKQVTSTGTETTIASHLIGGSYLLTKLLTPQLEASAANGKDPRVIFITSGGMYLTKMPSWDVATSTAQGQKYDPVMAYAHAKRGQVILAEELAKQNNGITYMTAHPGWSDTASVDDAFGSNKKYLEPLRTTWAGAEGITWLLHAKKQILQNGSFYLDRMIEPKHLSGPFMTEGKFTKNTKSEISTFMQNLNVESKFEN